ncbi:MAG: heparinase II/III family protein [Armatimonadetes bacterium]|nr:heparinase II/III family protein [Armatimonadota bacterium]
MTRPLATAILAPAFLGILFAALAGAIGARAAAQSPNLVPNPGLEAMADGKPLHWDFQGTTGDVPASGGLSTSAHSGRSALWCQGSDGSASWQSDAFTVAPDATYDVKVWVKVDQPASTGDVALYVRFDTHQAPGRTVVLTPGKWQAITDTVRSWPKSQTARIRIAAYNWEANVWLDDVSCRKSDTDWMERFPRTDLSRLKFRERHPRAVLSPTEVEELREAIQTEAWAQQCYARCLESADQCVAESPFTLPETPDMSQVTWTSWVAAIVYQLSGDDKYARSVGERLLASAERHPKGDMTRGGYGFTTGYALGNAASAYDLIADSDVLSPDDRGKIEAMLREGFAGMSQHGDVMGVNNRGAVCLGAMATIAVCLRDRELVEWTINGPYGFNYHVHQGIGDDGLWIEGISYGYMALGAGRAGAGYLSVAEAAYHAGIDLYSHPRLKRLLNAPLEYAYPDFTLPANGHCGYDESLLGQQEARRYIKPWTRLRDPRYAWLVSEGLQVKDWLPLGGHWEDLVHMAGNPKAVFPAGQPPNLTTKLFPDIGHAMLHAGEGEKAIAVLLDYGAFGSHGNPDKLSISLYAHERLLSPDGITGYWWPTTFLYECVTLGHNTVVVNETTQFPTAEKTLNAWIPAGPVTIVDAEDSDANPGVRMRRTLALTEGYLVDLFAVESRQARQYDWVYHNSGPLTPPPGLAPKAGTLGIRDGYEYLTGIRRGKVPGTWSAEWDISGMNRIWNPSFELQTGPVWDTQGWRVESSAWRPWISTDTAVRHGRERSLRIAVPEGKPDAVRLLAVYKRNRFRAGKEYLLEAYVRVDDARATEGDVGLWVGEEPVCKLSTEQADEATRGWVKISGVYTPRADNRELVAIGTRGTGGYSVWFDDISLRTREAVPRSLRLTMLGRPGTQVITSKGEGIRPFDEPVVIARRRGKATLFASVLEPCRGKPAVQSLRPLRLGSARGQAGLEVTTTGSVDRFAVSCAAESSGAPSSAGGDQPPALTLAGMVGALSVSRRSGGLRYLCLGQGTRLAGGGWSVNTWRPASLSLKPEGGGYLLQTWGAYAGPVSVRGPGLRGFRVRRVDANGKEAAVRAMPTAGGLRFEVQAGNTYRLQRP